jgi:hypothetical protein
MAENLTTDDVVSGDSFDEKTDPTYEDKVVGYDTANSKNIKILISVLAKKIITGGTVQTSISGADSIPVYNAGGGIAGYITYANLAKSIALAGTAQTTMASADRIKLYNVSGGIDGYITYGDLSNVLASAGTEQTSISNADRIKLYNVSGGIAGYITYANLINAYTSVLGANVETVLTTDIKSNMATALANNLNWGMTANTAGLTPLTTDVITTLTHVGDFAVFAATAQNVPDANMWSISCDVGGYSTINAKYTARRGEYVYFGYIATAGTITWTSYNSTVGDLVFTMVNDTILATRRILQLTGQVITIATYQVLCDAVYCGDDINATADCFYKTSDVDGTIRSTTGAYMVFADARGLAIVGEGLNAKIFAANGSSYSGGSRTVRYLQDQLQGHWHTNRFYGSGATGLRYTFDSVTGGAGDDLTGVHTTNAVTDGTHGTPRTGAYTRTPELGARICIRY